MNKPQYINKIRTFSDGMLTINSWLIYDIDEKNGTAWAQPMAKAVKIDQPNPEDRFAKAKPFKDGGEFPIERNADGIWGKYWNDWGTKRFMPLGKLSDECVIFATYDRFKYTPNWGHPYLASQKQTYRKQLGY